MKAAKTPGEIAETTRNLFLTVMGFHRGKDNIMSALDIYADSAVWYLVSIGQTPADVLGWCLVRGIKGNPGCASDCVIANLLRQAFGCDVTISHDSFSVGYDGYWVDRKTPDTVQQFITHFDNGVFPELIATGGGETENG